MDGMPIQFLNGIDGQATLGSTILDIMTGRDLLQGLGSTNPADADKGMYDYLVKTRNVIAARPDLVTNQNPAEALRMYDYAIKYWNTPNRDRALDALEREESKLMGLGAIVYDNQVEGLDGFWKSVKNTVKKTGKAIGKGAKFTANAVLRYNPVSIAARTGFQLAMRLNFNRMSEKLYPGYLTPQEAQQMGISPAAHQKALDALAKVRNMYVKVLRGREDKLKKAIGFGSRKKWTKPFIEDEKQMMAEVEAAKRSNVDLEADEGSDAVNGLLGDPAIVTAGAAAATPFIIKAWNWSKGLFTNEERDQHIKDAMAAGMTKKDAKESYRKVKKAEDEIKFREELARAKEKAKAKAKKAAESLTTPKKELPNTVAEEPENNSQNQPDMNVTNPNPSLFDRLKNPQNLLIVGGLVVGGILAYKYFTKPATAQPTNVAGRLDGVKKRRKPAKRAVSKTPAKRVIAPRRRKTSVKSLKLK